MNSYTGNLSIKQVKQIQLPNQIKHQITETNEQKHFLMLAFASLIFTMGSCLKSDENAANNCIPNNTGVPTAAEIASLQAYLTSKSIAATQHSGGFFT